ncbi:MAG: rRNA maturation RNase YbeY [Lachnospiraceae bacterium]|nr:rRNA maturation RNase YbeY [Lachnospiraceae bacterium]
MTILYEEKTGDAFPFVPEALAREVIEGVLKALSFPFEAEISLTLVSEAEIQELNRSFRGIDRSTDVLSFPLIAFDAPGDFSGIEADPDNFNPDSGEVMLGDIVLSTAHVRAQAKEYGHSEKREYAFLIVHSMLHLLGYDHETAEEEQEMTAMQEKILTDLGILR